MSRAKFILLSVAMAAFLCVVGCSEERPDPGEGVVMVKLTSPRENVLEGADAAWEGRLVEDSGCVGVEFPDGVIRIAVFYADDEVVVSDDGAISVTLADGTVLTSGITYGGLQEPIESVVGGVELENAAQCAEAMGTSAGVVIRTAEIS